MDLGWSLDLSRKKFRGNAVLVCVHRWRWHICFRPLCTNVRTLYVKSLTCPAGSLSCQARPSSWAGSSSFTFGFTPYFEFCTGSWWILECSFRPYTVRHTIWDHLIGKIHSFVRYYTLSFVPFSLTFVLFTPLFAKKRHHDRRHPRRISPFGSYVADCWETCSIWGE